MSRLDRRRIVTGLSAGAAFGAIAPSGWPATGALAQSPAAAPAAATANRLWPAIAALSGEAEQLGLSVPRMGFAASAASEDYNEVLPALIDLMDGIAASAADVREVSSAEVDGLLERASDLLRTARAAERTPREELGLGAAAVKAPAFDAIADDYRRLFATCKISDAKRNEVSWYVSKVTDPARRKDYQLVTDETCVPWYFVAITHGMEAGFDLKSHLHNGDTLKKKTVQVPAGRPNPWNPPTDWASSAIDAMRYDKLDEKPDWDLAKLLYRWETYNGWRSRVLQKINTPYLWSFSNHYSRGKYVADGVWDGNAVSKQCGAAVMLKVLIESGAVTLPA